MTSATDIAAEMNEGLARLFEAGLELALRIQADALSAEAPEARASLAVAFHRVSRGVRQTAALRMRLAGDLKRFQTEAESKVVSLEAARVEKRRIQVRTEVQRLIWTEGGDETDRENLTADLDELLDIEEQDEAFLEKPVEALVARIAAAMGLPPPAAAPSPPDDGADPEADDYQSSA
jgi:hypothetical protein